MTLNKKHIISWTLFDFANSSYSAVIAAVVFPVYYATAIVGNDAGLGDLWWGRAVSVSMAIVALSSPFLGGIADYGGIRKRFLFIYTVMSIAAIASLSILRQGMIIEGFLLVVIANIGMEGGLVFYNSFLPRIAPRAYQGRVSAWGFGVGYAGSIIALLLALPFVRSNQFEATWLMIALFFPYNLSTYFDLGTYAAAGADILFFLFKVFLVILFSVTLIRIGVARLRISQVVSTYWIALTLIALLGLVLIMWDSQVLTIHWW